MGTKLVRYELAGGASVLVEEDVDDRGGYVGRGDVVELARQRFEEALAMLRPATAAVMAEIQALVVGPEEVQLELGFSLKGEVGAVIAKTAAEGSFKLSLKWKPSGKG
ncbi:MAG: hypothetical protein JOZ17_25820 [Acetobacteraceae bacterium]|nr:hypothetical protein [Acetobacteraceae bacterium]